VSRFTRSDSDWLGRLEKKAAEDHEDAVERGDEGRDTVLPICRATGPGGVRCDQLAGHMQDHSGLAGTASKHDGVPHAGSAYAELGHRKGHRKDRDRRKKDGGVRNLHDNDRVTWKPICGAIGPMHIDPPAGVDPNSKCRLPARHQGKHIDGGVIWADNG
jgi:hypothetical protein